ncbi:UNVERIFIED_ORG: ABC-2 type transport system ATP-binding protein [Burkholderia contaminans]|nr:ABC-2 type transport system ATP-binding protein [Burkholderia contaminans]
MTEQAIKAQSLSRSFVRPRPFLSGRNRGSDDESNQIEALKDVSLHLEFGETLGLLGPNGAGKTSLIRIFSGLLQPSTGSISVLGKKPSLQDRHFLRSIALVAGNRRQLTWDLPARDTYRVLQKIYRIDQISFDHQLENLADMLGLGLLIDRPIKTLSFGQRMKCELCAALLHRPSLIFLDEPTIGLDASSRSAVLRFLNAYRAQERASIILTSHYMEDIEALADRTILLDQGQVRFEGTLSALKMHTEARKTLYVHYASPVDIGDEWGAEAWIERPSNFDVLVTVPRDRLRQTVEMLLALGDVLDMTVRDASVDSGEYRRKT